MTATHASASTALPGGSLIVTTEGSSALDWWDSEPYSKGLRVVLDEYVSAEESDDGHPFYWASTNGGVNNVVLAAEHVQLVKTPAQLAQTRVPTIDAMKEYLSRVLLDEGEGFEITETDRSDPAGDERTIAIYGRTDDNLPFGVHISVSPPFEADF